jgi:membrane protein
VFAIAALTYFRVTGDRMDYKTTWGLLRRTFSEWNEHEAPSRGASLAFYSLLSLAPLVILIISIVGLVFEHSVAENHLVAEIQSMIGQDGAETVKAMIEHAKKPASGSFASIIGLITLLVGASGVFAELQFALNKMWDLKPESGGGIVGTIKERIFSVGMVLGVGFLLLVSLLISTALAALGKFFSGLLPMPQFVLEVINFFVSFCGIAVLFALIFRYVPAVRISWRHVWVGASATALLFTIGKVLIGLYLGKMAVGSAYGAAGSLVVVIVWVYYSSMIVLFGAEFTHILDSRHQGSFG